MSILTVVLGLTVIVPILSLFVVEKAKNKWKETNWAGKTILIVVIVTSALGAYLSHRKDKKENLIERINAKFGNIEDLQGATVPKLGITGSGFVVQLPPTGVFAQDFNAKPFFRVYVKSGRLYVDIVIRDKEGKAIAVIDGNEWTLYSDEYEYNNDETGFELVTKGERKVYFHVNLVNGIAYILGYVITSEKLGFKFIPTPPNGLQKAGYLVAIAPDLGDSFYQGVDGAIFKYPRSKYLGMRK